MMDRCFTSLRFALLCFALLPLTSIIALSHLISALSFYYVRTVPSRSVPAVHSYSLQRRLSSSRQVHTYYLNLLVRPLHPSSLLHGLSLSLSLTDTNTHKHWYCSLLFAVVLVRRPCSPRVPEVISHSLSSLSLHSAHSAHTTRAVRPVFTTSQVESKGNFKVGFEVFSSFHE